MKTSLVASAIVAASLCAVAQSVEETAVEAAAKEAAVAAPAPAVSVAMGVDFKSAYVATGATCNDGPVFQPWAEIANPRICDKTVPLVFGFWANGDLDDDYAATRNADGSLSKIYNKGKFSEIDLSVDLVLSDILPTLDGLSYQIGYLEYDYPRGGNADHLIVFKAGYDCVLSPSFTAKYRFDGDSVDKCEYAVAISHSFEIPDTELELGLSADCWVVHQANGSDLKDGFACADFTASLSWKDLYVSCTYIAQLDDEVLPDGEFGYDSEWIAAVGVSLGF